MRGFLGGVSLGTLIAVAGAAIWSLSAPLPKLVEIGAETAAPDAGASASEQPELAPSARDADLAAAMPVAPEGTEVPEDLSAAGTADTAPANRPVVAGETGSLEGPEVIALAPDLPAADEAPVRMPPAAAAPAVPEPEAGIAVSPEPAPPPPDTGSADAAAPEESDSAADSSVPPGTEAEDAPAVAPAPQFADAVPEITLPETPQEPGRLPQVTQPPERQPVPGESSEDAGAQQEEDETAAQDGAATPGIGTPVVPFTERGKSGPEDTAGESAQSVSPAFLTPFEAFSEPFTNPEGRPLMSIVLIDDAKSIGAEAQAGFPYPQSFAIHPESPDAAEKMAARRAAGFEVLILADLPRGAAPQDAETALPVWLETLPEAVGVMEGAGTGVQGSRQLAEQVSAAAAANGLGLVLQNQGLNTVQKLAARDGVPSGVVFRDFDGAGQDPRAIRRFLDQAARQAGLKGSVIMMGRVRPDTISALLLWGLQDRASQVSLAPVSASMKANLPEAQ